MAHVGTVGKRIELEVKLVGEYHFTTYYGETTVYKMVDDDGNILVWKTSAYMALKGDKPIFPDKGDTIRIKATVKAHDQYKGEDQTSLTRLALLAITHKAPTKQELMEAKRKEQLKTLDYSAGDELWTMPYRQYKAHYSDCETLAGSFDAEGVTGRAVITVIIRAGRLVPSGTRGMHYSGYQFRNERDEIIGYRAVSQENAFKRVNKDFPGENWKLDRIYHYNH